MKSAKLNLFDVTMIVTSLVIGMGIFRTPVNVAREAATAELFFTAWIVGGLVTLCGALTYAEIGSRHPVTGGYYKIFSYCYHPSLAFAINGIILVSNAATVAGVSLIGAEYLANLLFAGHEHLEEARLVIAALAILLFYGVNLLGLRMSANAQNALMLIKIGMVVLLIGAVFTVDHPSAPATIREDPEYSWVSYLKSLGICLVAVSFTYGGYQQTINFGGEARNASRTLPRGIILGILMVMLLYLGINYAYYTVIGFDALKEAESIAAILAGAIFGEKGFSILSVLLFFSVLAYVNVSMMSNPRVIYAMGEEGALPQWFGKKSGGSRAMVPALTAFAALCLITLFYAKTFDEILSHIIFLDCIGMATSAATIFILRKRTAGMDKKKIYAMSLYPLLPVIFIVAYLLVGASIVIETPRAAIVSILVFSAFFALYFILNKINGKTKSAG